jgi:tetratricopeptide (TPR) repeat protein
VAGAIAACRKAIAERPDMPLAYLQLAYLERARGDLGAAVAAARRSLELRPLDGESLALTATYLIDAGRPREALALIEPYTKAVEPTLDVLTARGMALAALGRAEEALASFARGRELDHSNPAVLVNIGTVHLMAGAHGPARAAFEAALAIDGGLAKAENSLAVIASREGRLEEAVERWRRAAALDPQDYQALFNLGATLRRLGRAGEARPFLEGYLRAAPVATERADMERVRGWLQAPGP